MKNTNRKWLLTMLVACFLVATAFADRGRGCNPYQRGGCQQQPQPMPEGGSGAIYLLGAGLTCFGAMFLRSRIGKPAQS
jgi:hypothetical protein